MAENHPADGREEGGAVVGLVDGAGGTGKVAPGLSLT